MYLESLCQGRGERRDLPLNKGQDGIWRTDWEPLLTVMADARRSAAWRAEAFHSSMAFALLEQARRIRDEERVDQIGLCGGVFQNRTLTEQVVALLKANDFQVYLARELPCNDAALSFGQAAELAAREHDGAD
jgi:hydrogenase maturation protein HypF